jgi:ribosome-associated toxin RatA of RatAB toxin-antitoxin module
LETNGNKAVMFTRNRDALVQTGGRIRARLLLSAGVVVLAAVGLPASADDAGPHVTVREDAGLYWVAATFSVPETASVAVAVLTDYEQIPRFMPDVRTSKVLERGDSRVVVEQEAVARLMMFSRRIHLVLEVHEATGIIRFRDRCGTSFTRYEGSWRITPQGGRTAIAYELKADPSFDVPGFMLKRLLKRDAGQMIEHLQAEMTARSRR